MIRIPRYLLPPQHNSSTWTSLVSTTQFLSLNISFLDDPALLLQLMSLPDDIRHIGLQLSLRRRRQPNSVRSPQYHTTLNAFEKLYADELKLAEWDEDLQKDWENWNRRREDWARLQDAMDLLENETNDRAEDPTPEHPVAPVRPLPNAPIAPTPSRNSRKSPTVASAENPKTPTISGAPVAGNRADIANSAAHAKPDAPIADPGADIMNPKVNIANPGAPANPDAPIADPGADVTNRGASVSIFRVLYFFFIAGISGGVIFYRNEQFKLFILLLLVLLGLFIAMQYL